MSPCTQTKSSRSSGAETRTDSLVNVAEISNGVGPTNASESKERKTTDCVRLSPQCVSVQNRFIPLSLFSRSEYLILALRATLLRIIPANQWNRSIPAQ